MIHEIALLSTLKVFFFTFENGLKLDTFKKLDK